ncbi:MAG: beta-hydroxyacyl-ACP dehydratase [Phycisphaerae bacterium]|nr:beta-hydroxyacyl-ACP dehydratase [Phycisphaerae bacterium]
MPTEPIIDLSAIDLNARVMSRDDIALINAHRGVMAMLDAVVWLNDELSQGVAIKHVRDDEFWVAGHIPGRPLMPGVLMVETAAQLASLIYYKRTGIEFFAGFTRIENVAFRGQVVPGDDFYLLCREVKFSLKRFVTDIQGIVNGQIVFEGCISGMVFPNLGRVVKGRLVESNASVNATR